MYIKSTVSLLLLASLASAYPGDIDCRLDEVLSAIKQLGLEATPFCSSYLGIGTTTITAATVTPTVYVDFLSYIPHTFLTGTLCMQNCYCHEHNPCTCQTRCCGSVPYERIRVSMHRRNHQARSPAFAPVRGFPHLGRLLAPTHHRRGHHSHRNGSRSGISPPSQHGYIYTHNTDITLPFSRPPPPQSLPQSSAESVTQTQGTMRVATATGTRPK